MSEKYTFRFVFTGANDCMNETYYTIIVPEDVTEAKVRHIIASTHIRLSNQARQAMELEMRMDDLTEQEQRELADADANNPYFGVPETADSLLKYICKEYKGWSFKAVTSYFHMPSGEWGLRTQRTQQQNQNPLSMEAISKIM